MFLKETLQKRAFAIEKRETQRQDEAARQKNREIEKSTKNQQEADEKKIIFKKTTKDEMKKLQEEDDELCKAQAKGGGKSRKI